MEINEVDPAVEKADEDVEEPDSNEKCKSSSSQDETLPDSTNDQKREEEDGNDYCIDKLNYRDDMTLLVFLSSLS